MTDTIKISVVIPHYNGIRILKDCLESLYKNNFGSFETILIDNGSTDGSQNFVRENFPQVRLICNEQNRGYAGGCNQGIDLAGARFVLLLNNDTVMPENFLEEMYKAISAGDHIAMVQPKILSIQNPKYFDYSGGAGGELDLLGYPFARGRIFDDVETDTGQYDTLPEQVFWTSGCALLLDKNVTDTIGKLDEDFFAHQEEIDLNWRAQLAGYRNVVTMKTYIYHYSGYTLRNDNEHKMYLNHRNNLIMMIKNYGLLRLLLFFPPRVVMELTTVIVDALFWEGKRARAVLKALTYIFTHPRQLLRKRTAIQKLRRVGDRRIIANMYRGSIVMDHFLRKMNAEQCVAALRASKNKAK